MKSLMSMSWSGAQLRIEKRTASPCTSTSDALPPDRFEDAPCAGRKAIAAFSNRHALDKNAIDRLTGAALLAAPNGRIFALNRAAETLLAQRDGLSLVGQTLGAAEDNEQRLLRRELQRITLCAPEDSALLRVIITVSRPSGRIPYLLLLAPMLWHAVSGHCEMAGLVLLEDPEQSITGSIRRIGPCLNPFDAPGMDQRDEY